MKKKEVDYWLIARAQRYAGAAVHDVNNIAAVYVGAIELYNAGTLPDHWGPIAEIKEAALRAFIAEHVLKEFSQLPYFSPPSEEPPAQP